MFDLAKKLISGSPSGPSVPIATDLNFSYEIEHSRIKIDLNLDKKTYTGNLEISSRYGAIKILIDDAKFADRDIRSKYLEAFHYYCEGLVGSNDPVDIPKLIDMITEIGNPDIQVESQLLNGVLTSIEANGKETKVGSISNLKPLYFRSPILDPQSILDKFFKNDWKLTLRCRRHNQSAWEGCEIITDQDGLKLRLRTAGTEIDLKSKSFKGDTSYVEFSVGDIKDNVTQLVDKLNKVISLIPTDRLDRKKGETVLKDSELIKQLMLDKNFHLSALYKCLIKSEMIDISGATLTKCWFDAPLTFLGASNAKLVDCRAKGDRHIHFISSSGLEIVNGVYDPQTSFSGKLIDTTIRMDILPIGAKFSVDLRGVDSLFGTKFISREPAFSFKGMRILSSTVETSFGNAPDKGLKDPVGLETRNLVNSLSSPPRGMYVPNINKEYLVGSPILEAINRSFNLTNDINYNKFDPDQQQEEKKVLEKVRPGRAPHSYLQVTTGKENYCRIYSYETQEETYTDRLNMIERFKIAALKLTKAVEELSNSKANPKADEISDHRILRKRCDDLLAEGKAWLERDRAERNAKGIPDSTAYGNPLIEMTAISIVNFTKTWSNPTAEQEKVQLAANELLQECNSWKSDWVEMLEYWQRKISQQFDLLKREDIAYPEISRIVEQVKSGVNQWKEKGTGIREMLQYLLYEGGSRSNASLATKINEWKNSAYEKLLNDWYKDLNQDLSRLLRKDPNYYQRKLVIDELAKFISGSKKFRDNIEDVDSYKISLADIIKLVIRNIEQSSIVQTLHDSGTIISKETEDWLTNSAISSQGDYDRVTNMMGLLSGLAGDVKTYAATGLAKKRDAIRIASSKYYILNFKYEDGAYECDGEVLEINYIDLLNSIGTRPFKIASSAEQDNGLVV